MLLDQFSHLSISLNGTEFTCYHLQCQNRCLKLDTIRNTLNVLNAENIIAANGRISMIWATQNIFCQRDFSK